MRRSMLRPITSSGRKLIFQCHAGCVDWNTVGFFAINHLAADAPWADPIIAAFALWGGPVLLVVLLVTAWWRHRNRASAASSSSAAVLTGIAAVLGLGANQVASQLWREPRPFVTHPHVTMLLTHAADNSFPSDHATIGAALAVGTVAIARRWGVLAVFTALGLAFARVYAGMHYPLDVLAGLGIGTLVTLLVLTTMTAPVARVLMRRTPAPLRPLITAQSTHAATGARG